MGAQAGVDGSISQPSSGSMELSIFELFAPLFKHSSPVAVRDIDICNEHVDTYA